MVDCRIACLLALVLGAGACWVPNPLFFASDGEDTGAGTDTDPASSGVEGSGPGPGTSGAVTTADPVTTTASTANTTSSSGGAAVCGNGVHEPGEQCDDGNLIPGDDCELNCRPLFRPYDTPVDGSEGAVAFAVGDLDGDGDDDLALGFPTCPIDQACVRTFLNDGDAGFTEAGLVPLAEAPARLFVADWDEDGAVDILATHVSGFISLAFAGAIEPPVELAYPGDMAAAVVARVDGDDLLDLVIPDEAGLKIRYVLANGFGFTQPNEVAAALAPRHVAVADVDKSGEADVLYSIFTGPTTGFSVKLGFEGGDIGPFTSNANNASAIAVGEFDDPPWPNVVYSDPVGDTLQVFNNKGAGQFEKSSDTIDAEPGMLRLLSARINTQDVDNIIALAPAALQIFSYDGGQIVSGPSLLFAGTGIDVAVGRLGGDARVDLAILTSLGVFTLINQSGE